LSQVRKNYVAKFRQIWTAVIGPLQKGFLWVKPIQFKIRKFQMKKVLVAALVIAGLAFSGCSKKAEEANTTVEANKTEANVTVEANKTEANATEANKTEANATK
jgi:hypothetical protein